MTNGSPGQALLSVQNITRSYGAQPVLREVSLTIHEGDRIGLIGRNGSGKSTLLRILAGQDAPDSGLVTRSQGLRVSLLAQVCRLDGARTVAQALEDAAEEKRSMLARYNALVITLADEALTTGEQARLREEADSLHHALDLADAWDISHELKRIAVSLALPEPERPLATLSGGELRRVDLASKLLQHPDVLLLDEPTNHIDTRSVEWIEGFLETYSGSCVLVTHDRYFLDRVVNRIVEIEFQRIYSFPGSYERFLEYKAVVEDTRARTEDNRLALIRRELAWFRRGAKARTTKQKARIGRLVDVQ
ncbi:MAG: ABC-F family ATP-binding cassette domain-containing protein, partial [Candidatus Hydrogenedentes bacterium]|nr:ABC-F family ATP-binding cassette domain-containing protein [Candidatus Hydrogenedentota bacterium]